MYRLKYFIEWKAFGVCSAIGDKLGHRYFLYTSVVYLYFVFDLWLAVDYLYDNGVLNNIKKYILSARRNPLKYLKKSC